tara:strand:+ start:2325 stop:3512 length:1188 start_codon:yes stop_codon:yes gene_type:complete
MIGVGVSLKFLGKTVGGGPRNLAPVITSSPVTTATDGTAYSYQVQATDPEGGSLSYSLPTKPTGMTISASGLVQWTPSSAGSEAVIIRVTDDKAAFTDQAYTIAVAEIPYLLDILVVGGGGSGGCYYWSGGGGGAGGLKTLSQVAPVENTNYTITVGAGGADNVYYYGGNKGTNSVISGTGITTTTSTGGGAGGAQAANYSAYNGACGGGAGVNAALYSGGTGSEGGYGGANTIDNKRRGSGGGGGMSASTGTGGDSTFNSSTQILKGGDGGDGLAWLNGTTYAGGGGGGAAITSGTFGDYYFDRGLGGSGGGGSAGYGSSYNLQAATDATINTGSGGGGGVKSTGYVINAGSGASGVVIIRYTGAQRGTGGTVTSAGGYTYHTFNSSSTFNSGS